MRDEGDEGAGLWIHESPAELLAARWGGRAYTPPARKTIHVTQHRDELLFSVFHDDAEPEDVEGVCVEDRRKAAEDVLHQVSDLSARTASRSYTKPEGRHSQWHNLKGLGAKLFDTLLSPSLRAMIRTWPDAAWIAISSDSNSDWIPWELLYDGSGFLGQRFVLYRLPRIRSGVRRDARSTSQEESADPAAVRSCEKIVHIVGGALTKATVRESQRHFAGLRGVVVLHEKYLEDFFREAVDANVLHLTCHGYSDPVWLQIAKEEDPGVNLMVTSLDCPAFGLKEPCLVFANACSSARPQAWLDDSLSFGWAFYAKGAGLFIGSLGTIPSRFAIYFAQAFYDALIEECDGNASCAYRAAKQRLGETDSAVLMYCLYGNPLTIPQFHFHR